LAGAGGVGRSAAALEEGARMSGKLKAMRGTECFEEFYGVDGDGLGEGEVSCLEELENETFSWSPGDNALMCARARA